MADLARHPRERPGAERRPAEWAEVPRPFDRAAATEFHTFPFGTRLGRSQYGDLQEGHTRGVSAIERGTH